MRPLLLAIARAAAGLPEVFLLGYETVSGECLRSEEGGLQKVEAGSSI
jgi:hypothetical protein